MTRGYNHRNSWFPYEKWWFSIVNYSLPEGIYHRVKKLVSLQWRHGSWAQCRLKPLLSPQACCFMEASPLRKVSPSCGLKYVKIMFGTECLDLDCFRPRIVLIRTHMIYYILYIYIHIIFNTPKGVIIGDVLSYSPYIPCWCCTSIIVNNAPLMLLYPHFSYVVNPNLPKASQSWFTWKNLNFWWLNPLVDG